MKYHRTTSTILAGVTVFLFQLGLLAQSEERMAEKVTSIEGITEYRLPNGTQVLLLPDRSKSIVTVNMTVFVGSRHEGYGEAGMAHLLEHMLFKGTPSHEDIPELMKNRGANFNGTTWLDRTNYYETLPATSPEQASDNLEFAVRLEADRLVNSYIRGEDLASEMTVVRNEFERGENSPRRILMQRVQSAAFEWHNYGKSTIGNRSDIERVPVNKLREFYRKFYRPDNIMLVIGGNFDTDQALRLVEKYFGILTPPEVPLDRTYTIEPPQDGERTVALRRVGNTQHVMAAYHVPSGANREYAAVEMLAYIFGTEPSGRLYQALVVPEIASSVSTMSMALHDPGLILFTAQVPVSQSIESARQTMLQAIEGVGQEPITETELKRAQSQFFKDRDLRANDTERIAIELSEWAAQGDWRLYFLFRDYVEQVTPEQCTAAAEEYLVRNNRTVGLFLPSEVSERVEIPPKPDLEELLADYNGREDIAQGEAFDPSPKAIESRTIRGELACGLRTAWLPKKTRGQSVHINVNLRYGNAESLYPYQAAIEMMPRLLLRGTQKLDYQQLQDRIDGLRTQIRPSGTTGLLSLAIETKREYLPELIPLVGQILREPRFDPQEVKVLGNELVTSIEASLTEPQALAGISVSRALAPYPESDIRYVPTLEERIERYRSVTAEQLHELHNSQLSAMHGEVTAVGDFQPEMLEKLFQTAFEGWTSDVSFARIAQPAVDVAGETIVIQTPDKANAVFYAAQQLPLTDSDPDYPELVIGNFILGGGALSNRLADRVRGEEGLSYTIGSNLSAHPIDPRCNAVIFAISSPDNMEKLQSTIDEELQRFLEEGITEEELAAAKKGYLESQLLPRTQDSSLASILARTIFAERDMSYYAQFEDAIAELTVEQVNEAFRKHVEPDEYVIAQAGDFKAAQASQ